MDDLVVDNKRQLLVDLDGIFTSHPFGNSGYITEQLHACFLRRLDKIGKSLCFAPQLLDVLVHADAYTRYRVVGSTVVRCAIQHALVRLETGTDYGLQLEQCDDIFQTALHHVREGNPDALGCGMAKRLGAEPHLGWIWSENGSDAIFVESLRSLVRKNYGGEPREATAEEVINLKTGLQLLALLAPKVSRSALSHAHTIAIFSPGGEWKGTASSSEFKLSGTLFLSSRFLSNPWWVAEHLLHEVLHQQLYDIRQAHSLLIPNFDREGAPYVHSIWNLPDGNHWDTHRALAAFHVYVYLSWLSILAEQRASELEDVYGPLSAAGQITGSRRALHRAHYLAEQLKSVSWNELGLAGKRFVEFLTEILKVLDDSPPPPGSRVHLLLERYRKEANYVEALLRKGNHNSELGELLKALAIDEIKKTRGSFATSQAYLSKFDKAITQIKPEQYASFPSIRRLIIEYVMKGSLDGSDSRLPDDILSEMVECSSEQLKGFLANG